MPAALRLAMTEERAMGSDAERQFVVITSVCRRWRQRSEGRKGLDKKVTAEAIILAGLGRELFELAMSLLQLWSISNKRRGRPLKTPV